MKALKRFLNSRSYVWSIVIGIALFWGLVATLLGPAKGLRNDQPGQLSTIFGIWETAPASEHFYLPFFKPRDFEAKVPYTHFPPTFTFLIYGYLRGVEWLLGIPLVLAQNLVFIPYVILFLIVVASMVRTQGIADRIRDPRGALVMFLSMGVVLTNGSLWTGFSLRNVNFNALTAIVFLILGALTFAGRLYTRGAFLVLLFLAFFAPLYTLCGLLVLGLFYERDTPSSRKGGPVLGAREKAVLKAGASLLITALINAYYPRIVVELTGAFTRAGGGSVFFRSGLDGDAKYFTDLLGAMIDPYIGTRKAHALHMPLAAMGFLATVQLLCRDSALTKKCVGLWVICLSPYLFKLCFFPQAVATHPYNFDVFLTLSSAFAIAFWSWQPRVLDKLTGSVLVLYFFGCTAIIMTSLIDIARCWPR